MTYSKDTDCCLTQGYIKRYIKLPCRIVFSNKNVVFAVVIIMAAVFLFFSPAMIFNLSSERTTRSADDRHLASTELQSRMKSFLVRNSAVHKPTDNEFVVSWPSPGTQSHG